MRLPPGNDTIMSGRCAPLSLVACDLEVAMLEHARELDHAAQLHLAPTPAHHRLAQRFDQIRSLPAQ